jgi:two-component system cell cycle response regulator
MTMPWDESDPTWNVQGPATRSSEKRSFLMVLSGPQFGEIFELEPGRESVIGRKAGVEILIRDGGVSRRHAVIIAQGGETRIRDLESQNGTFVDGIRVTDCPLVDGNRIHLGVSTALKFVCGDDVEIEFQRRLCEGAFHEPLTGLYNRRHFMDRLGAEMAAAQRHERALSLLLIDIDHFKAVNDKFGHLAGDEALKMIAHVLKGSARKEDILARLGGEEFVVLSRETALPGGRALAERIRKAVERSRYAWEGQDIKLTVSIGVTVSIGLTEFKPGRNDRELLAAADKALYQAKQAGRNCVVAVPLDPTEDK